MAEKNSGLFKKYRSRVVKEGILKAVVCGLIVGFAVLIVTALAFWFAGVPWGLWLSIALFAAATGASVPALYFLKFKPTAKAIAKRIDQLGLEERMTAHVGLLSGGQRQALTLLMATLVRPQLLLLDEHTAALDPKTAAKVLELTDRLVTTQKLTTLMITHNMRDALRYGNRLVMMHAGRIVVDVKGDEKKHLTVPDLLALFEKTAFLPAGVLSENARLAVLINSRFPRQFCAHKAADIAVMRLAQALSSTQTYASAKERLVLLRAAAEISGIRDYAALRGKCLETGLSILKYQDKNGLFAFSGAGADIAENALAVSFLAKLSSHSPDARIEQALKHCAKALVKILNMPGEMPAAVDRGKMGRIASQASSYEYAYLCSALADMHKLTGENAYLDALSKSADEWGRFYMTKLGLFSVNSQNSALGGFLRPVLVEDYEMPSYLGEAAQSAKYLSKHRRNAAFPCGGKLAIMSDAAFRQIPLNNGSYASFKLAALR